MSEDSTAPGLPLRSAGQAAAQPLPKGRHGLSRQFIASNQRERLLDAIANVVAEKGYAATRVADITDYAGVSRKTFYELFSDKEDCFLAAYDASRAMLMDRLAHACGGGRRPWEGRCARAARRVPALPRRRARRSRGCASSRSSGSGPARPGAARRGDRGVLPGRRPDPAGQQPGAERWLSGMTPMFVTGGILEVVYAAIRRGETRRSPSSRRTSRGWPSAATCTHKEWEALTRERGARP